jgi:hypothetical protein
LKRNSGRWPRACFQRKAQDKLIDAIWNLEKCASVTKLMALMKADVRRSRQEAPSRETCDGAQGESEAVLEE